MLWEGELVVQITIPDGDLLFLCGAAPIQGMDMERAVKSYLYGEPRLTREREIMLGVRLVQMLVRQLQPESLPFCKDGPSVHFRGID